MKILKTLIFFILTLTVCAQITSAQSDQWPKTFLWKISGNGLPTPSYLFGTMQIEDKRLFHFPDSVYHAIRSTSGFAMELNMSDAIIAMARPVNQTNDLITIERRTLHRSVDSLLLSMGIKGDKISKKILLEIRRNRVSRITDSLMPTIPDGLLFGIASALGKDLAAINKFSEEISDEGTDNILLHQALSSDDQLRDDINEMVRIYNDRNLNEISDCVDCGSEVKKKMLTSERAKLMIDRMDSMMFHQSWFFTVAAALLPGDLGIINSLRAMGYRVDPVFSPTTINALNYYQDLESGRWKRISVEGYYSLELPGVPSEFTLDAPGSFLKLFFDMPTGTHYTFGYVLRGPADQEAVMLTFRQMALGMAAKYEDLNPTIVTKGDELIIEDTFAVPHGRQRLRLVQKGIVMYILASGYDEGSGDRQAQSRFFNSFLATYKPESATVTAFTIPEKGFTIELPGAPKANPLMNKQTAGPMWKYTTYDLMDATTGTYYVIQIQELSGTSYIEGDTMYYNTYWNNLANAVNIIDKKPVQLQGWPAFTIHFTDNLQTEAKLLTVLRGKRIYSISAAGKQPQLADMEKVLSSFKLTDIPSEKWSKYDGGDFRTFAPSEFRQAADLTANNFLKEGSAYHSFDNQLMLSCEVYVAEPIDGDMNADELLEAQIGAFKKRGDIVRMQKRFTRGKTEGIDFELQKPGSNIVRKFRVLFHGGLIYAAYSAVPEDYLNDDNVRKFFNEFNIVK